jgi:guanine deaminase
MNLAVELAVENVRSGKGGPFGALVVKDGQLIGTGVNLVTANSDPTAHAEVLAIRSACQRLGDFRLDGCELYASCEPCPMCLGAIFWAHIRQFFYACTRKAAADAGFDDDSIYAQLRLNPDERTIPGHCVLPDLGTLPFVEWADKAQKVLY